jgi:hypothetical protein
LVLRFADLFVADRLTAFLTPRLEVAFFATLLAGRFAAFFAATNFSLI